MGRNERIGEDEHRVGIGLGGDGVGSGDVGSGDIDGGIRIDPFSMLAGFRWRLRFVGVWIGDGDGDGGGERGRPSRLVRGSPPGRNGLDNTRPKNLRRSDFNVKNGRRSFRIHVQLEVGEPSVYIQEHI